MTRTPEDSGRPRTGWPVRVVVLGPLAVAALATNTGMDHLGPLWMAALAWTVLGSLAGALLRGLRHGDWSAFRRHRFPENTREIAEFGSRTGRYQWLGDHEDRLRHHDNYLR